MRRLKVQLNSFMTKLYKSTVSKMSMIQPEFDQNMGNGALQNVPFSNESFENGVTIASGLKVLLANDCKISFSGLNCPISDEDMMQVNQGKTNPNTAGILTNGGADPLKRKSTGCQDEDSINEVVYAAQVNLIAHKCNL